MYNYNTLGENFLQYKRFLGYSYKTEEVVIKEIVDYLTFNKIEEITKNVTQNYARNNQNIASNTLARNMGTFREFCIYLKQQGIQCYQIPQKLYPQNHKNYTPYIFSHKEISRIYRNLNIPLQNYHYSYYRQVVYPLIIKILYQTGMRIGEVLKLRIDDYNVEYGCFKLNNTKNDNERIIILSNDLKLELEQFLKKFSLAFRRNTLIFNVSQCVIENYFFNLLNLSNIPRNENSPRLHDLRHTFIVHRIQKYIEDGTDLNTILPILQVHVGHQSLNSLSYYFHLTKEILIDIKETSEKELNYLIPSLEESNNEKL